MAKCSFCEKSAVYVNPISRLAYCRKHFIEYFERRVRRTMRKYNMLSENEHIVVATSGGKDSISLLHILVKLSRKNPKWRITAVLVDEGIKGYRERTVENLVNYAEARGVPYVIASFREYIGMTLDEIVEEGHRRGLPYMPCSYCGVFRRYVINQVAHKVEATVIATAHNMDDIVQTYLMNIFSNSWDRVSALTPVRNREVSGFIKRIKPFYEVPEKESALYAILNNLVKPEFIQCPYVKYNVRFTIRKMLNELEDKYPGIKYGLLRSLQVITPILKGQVESRDRYNCLICGEPSSQRVCKACLYKIQLGLLSAEKVKFILNKARSDKALASLLKYYNNSGSISNLSELREE
jgi:uncharacterized protein (TIGR00269 family)